MARDFVLDRLHLAHFYRNAARTFRFASAPIASAASGACVARKIEDSKPDVEQMT